MIDLSKEIHIFKPKQKYISAIQWTGNNLDEIEKFTDIELLVSQTKQLILPKFNDNHQFVTAKDKAEINDFVVRDNERLYFVKEYDFLNQYEIVE